MTFEEYRTNKASESKKLREEAARDLVNISANERERRKRIGQVLAVVTVGAATYLLATGAGPTTRLVIFPLFFFSFGYLQSARQGLCNIGNGNMWDVDGLGLSVIQDSELASKIRDKVNDMNVKGLLISAAVTGAFVALPALPQ